MTSRAILRQNADPLPRWREVYRRARTRLRGRYNEQRVYTYTVGGVRAGPDNLQGSVVALPKRSCVSQRRSASFLASCMRSSARASPPPVIYPSKSRRDIASTRTGTPVIITLSKLQALLSLLISCSGSLPCATSSFSSITPTYQPVSAVTTLHHLPTTHHLPPSHPHRAFV